MPELPIVATLARPDGGVTLYVRLTGPDGLVEAPIEIAAEDLVEVSFSPEKGDEIARPRTSAELRALIIERASSLVAQYATRPAASAPIEIEASAQTVLASLKGKVRV